MFIRKRIRIIFVIIVFKDKLYFIDDSLSSVYKNEFIVNIFKYLNIYILV